MGCKVQMEVVVAVSPNLLDGFNPHQAAGSGGIRRTKQIVRYWATRTMLMSFLSISLALLSWGQVRIEGDHTPEISQEQVTLLFNATFRVVAEEFRLRGPSEVQVPVTLVLGSTHEGVVGDETSQTFTIYMSQWDETMFVTSVSRIALQHLLSHERKAKIVMESLRRAKLASPVAFERLTYRGGRPLRGPGSLLPGPLGGSHIGPLPEPE